jgi:hypothetical protein
MRKTRTKSVLKKLAIFIFISFLLVSPIIAPSFAQETASTSSDEKEQSADEQNEIREKVREKIEKAQNKPKAYVGTITDISHETLQIKNKDDEIQLVSLNTNETSFAQVNDETKTVSFDELAIGDFTVSMGYINDTDVLDAKRILITSPIKEPNRKIVFGNVQQIVKKEITIVSRDGKETTLSFPKRWKGPEISELKKDINVAVVYQPENGILTIRTIEIVPDESPVPTSESNN